MTKRNMAAGDRQTGITTQQIKDAPAGAVFVWCNGHLDYPKWLARDLGRSDLIIVSPMALDSHRFMGMTLTGLVVDHAARLTDRQIEEVQALATRMRIPDGNSGT